MWIFSENIFYGHFIWFLFLIPLAEPQISISVYYGFTEMRLTKPLGFLLGILYRSRRTVSLGIISNSEVSIVCLFPFIPSPIFPMFVFSIILSFSTFLYSFFPLLHSRSLIKWLFPDYSSFCSSVLLTLFSWIYEPRFVQVMYLSLMEN